MTAIFLVCTLFCLLCSLADGRRSKHSDLLGFVRSGGVRTSRSLQVPSHTRIGLLPTDGSFLTHLNDPAVVEHLRSGVSSLVVAAADAADALVAAVSDSGISTEGLETVGDVSVDGIVPVSMDFGEGDGNAPLTLGFMTLPKSMSREDVMDAILAFLKVVNPQVPEDIRRVGASAAWVGGSVGVGGSLTAIWLKMQKVKSRETCAYCRGSGSLACGSCGDTGVLRILEKETGKVTKVDCPTCRGTREVLCVNCRGDGMAVPPMLRTRRSRDPEGLLEDSGLS